MPTVRVGDTTIQCEAESNLKKVLKTHNLPVYNGSASILNCKGLGTCGTCCVFVEGALSPMTKVEKWRLSFPPHKGEVGKRLACQAKVEGNVVVRKGDGFWGGS